MSKIGSSAEMIVKAENEEEEVMEIMHEKPVVENESEFFVLNRIQEDRQRMITKESENGQGIRLLI